MKRFSSVSRLLTSAAAIALMLFGVAQLSSCEQKEDDQTETVVLLATPQNTQAGAYTAEEASFKWSAVEGAYNYTAQLKTSTYGSIIKETIVTAPLTEVTFSELTPGTKYYFHVRANDQYSEGRNSFFTDWVEITTQTVDPQYDPLSAPENVVCDQTQSTVSVLVFRWDVVENAASYTYKITPVAGTERTGIVSDGLSAKVEGLEQGTTYTFAVRANPAENSDRYRSSSYSKNTIAKTLAELAKPVVTLDGDATRETVLRFTWAEVEGAVKYAYTVARERGEWSAEEFTTNTYLVLEGLDKTTVYSIMVRAIPVEASVENVDSQWSDPASGTTMAGQPVIMAAPTGVALDGTAAATRATIVWTAVESAAGYLYQLSDETAAEVAVDQAKAELTGLTPQTDYRIRLKTVAPEGDEVLRNSEWGEWFAFTTAAPAATATVSNVEEFLTALDEIANGGIITLNAGEYSFVGIEATAGTFVNSTIKITKSVTIQGASPSARPHINAKNVIIAPPAETPLTVAFKNIEYSALYADPATGTLTATLNSGGYFIDNSGSAAPIASLSIENCVIHDVVNAMARLDRVAACGAIDLTVTDNLIYNLGGKNGGMISAKGCSVGGNWLIENNTVDGVGSFQYCADNAATTTDPGKQRIITLPKEVVTFNGTIRNNTFFNYYNNTNFAIDTQSNNDCGTITVEKNIFYCANETAGNKEPKLGNNAAVNVTSNCVFPAWVDDSAVNTPATGTINEDPVIAGAGKLDYTPANANVIAGSIGDSRWLTGAVAKADLFWGAERFDALTTTYGSGTEVTTDFTYEGLSFVAGGGKFKFGPNKNAAGETASRLQFGGTGSLVKACVKFTVEGPGTLKVEAGSSGSTVRPLKVFVGETAINEAGFDCPANSELPVIHEIDLSTATAGDVITICSGNSGMNLFSIRYIY